MTSNPILKIADKFDLPEWVAYCIADFMLALNTGQQRCPTWHVLAMAELTRIVGRYTDEVAPSFPFESIEIARAQIIEKVLKEIDTAVRQQRGMEARHGKAPAPAA